ncbi:hypothetical protein [Methylobacterium radiodurans]|uniref:Uncharacterized protein n=1 Tax=Methylobacterium radiodurans TaxID=2202828 RepID=A0A2U8VQ46_9HYPH|nr:hypothetical protein [Methylobacterium radiodurans]AWN35763.1 hypothetical protein DK427_08400 [Methylobacterium radiodurans]
MGEVVQLRPDPDQALTEAWNALTRAYDLAVRRPTIRNMVGVARAWDAYSALIGFDAIADAERRL